MDVQKPFDWAREIQRHRTDLLDRLLLSTVIIGVVGLPVFYLFRSAATGTLGTVTLVAFFFAWLITLVARLWRGLGYGPRALSLILVSYIINTVIFIDNGVLDSVDAWMLLPLALAFVLLGPRSGMLVGGWGNLLLYAGFAVAVGRGWVAPRTVADSSQPSQLIVLWVGHLLAVVVLALILRSYNQGWLGALKSTREANRELEAKTQELVQAYAELDRRVIARTAELAEALAKNEAILDSIADGVIVFDNEGKAVVANPAIAGLLEMPAEEIVGCGIEMLMGSEVGAEDREAIVALLEDRERRHPSVRFAWGHKTFLASVAPVRLASSEVTGTVAVFRDFTREAEIDRMKSTFVSIASHELRTPLGAIRGLAEMLQESVYGPLVEKQRRIVERIVSNVDYMLGLANNLLDRARMEAGTLPLDVIPFCPAELLGSVLETMAVLARTKGVALESDLSQDLPGQVLGDRARVKQIMVNLVGNGLKFTSEGEVRVRAFSPDADHWAVEVSDTGRGIPKEAHVYIFEPFRQVEDPDARGYRGAGLGLSIVRDLVEVMGGEITLESQVQRGSTFTVVLPLSMGESHAALGS